MDLEEIKNQWDKMSKDIKKQKILTDKLIIDMTQEKYNNKLKLISIPETIGTVICFAGAIYIFINFGKLDTWYMQLSGLFTALFCIILPILSLRSIFGMQKLDMSNNNYKQSIEKFAKSKKQFVLIQKVSFYLSFILVLVCLPVAGKLMNNKDLFLESKVWLWYIPFGFVFLYVISRWVFKKYKRATTSAENLLKELETL
ncbi:hypothetical protein [uncultured Lutibacter sp.]|uniref:hypothetical protein n=1 Tax=uncultured Lutibacter sp. TaxID=437739 RepID=UPI002612F896|nr:hypothetical protein [uncultured Lutibacter sp.]